MKKQWLYFLFVLLSAAIACNVPVQIETVEPPPAVTPTEPLQPSETPLSPLTPTSDLPVVVPEETEEDPYPVVYGDRSTTPPQIVLLNPLNGALLHRVDAPNLGFGFNRGVYRDGVFYVDADYSNAYRLSFSGVLQELSFLNPDGGYFEGVILPSPDGLRMAVGSILSYDASGTRVQLKVINADGTGEHILVDEVLSERPTRPTPIRWSGDGRSIYYMNVIDGVEGFGGTDLYQVDIESGTRTMIFDDLNCLCSTSVSPDETRAVRVMRHGTPVMVIKNLQTGAEDYVSFPAKYLSSWDIVWAPDSSAMAITLGLGNREADLYSVVHVAMNDLSQRFLTTDDPRLLRAVDWPVMATLWLNDTDGNLWHMDPESLELTLTASDARLIRPSR